MTLETHPEESIFDRFICPEIVDQISQGVLEAIKRNPSVRIGIEKIIAKNLGLSLLGGTIGLQEQYQQHFWQRLKELKGS